MPSCTANVAFDEVVTLVVPKTIASFDIKQVKLVKVNNLYTGLSYVSNPTNNIFPAGANHCIQISGTPTDRTETGQDSVFLDLEIELNPSGMIPQTVGVYFKLIDPLSVPQKEILTDRFRILPSPVQQEATIHFTEITQKNSSIKVFSILGEEVWFEQLAPGIQEFKMDTGDLPNGVYTVFLDTETSISSSRMIIKN